MDANEWELYSDMDGVEGVAEKLTEALEKAKKAFTHDLAKKTGPEALSDAWRGLYEVLNQHSDYGAVDTEPRCVARHALAKHAAFRVTGKYDNFVINEYLEQLY
tara:strand:- start:11015 stop:11326 length:312 start_codon:yes stop_codon:yes gene_type:complete